MPNPKAYSELNNPTNNPPHDIDSDDDDLDLQELDPFSESNSYSIRGRTSKEELRNYQERHGLFPLRNLPAGSSERYADQFRSFSKGSHYEEHGGSSHGVEDGQESQRVSQGELEFGDEAPLLQSGNTTERRRNKHERGSFDAAGLASRLRLPSFMSNPPRLTSSNSQDEPNSGQSNDASAEARTIAVGRSQTTRFPPNIVSNAKYTPWSFLPRTLYNEFKFFFNMYFLLVALSQVIPVLRIGYLSTYIVPLVFVLSITLGKEAIDDVARRRRDAESNSEGYTILDFKSRPSSLYRDAKEGLQQGTDASARLLGADGANSSRPLHYPIINVPEKIVRSRDLKVGDVLKIQKDQRVPADIIILKSVTVESKIADGIPETQEEQEAAKGVVDLLPESSNTSDQATSSESSGADDGKGDTFIRTDQLDGETDWKLRLASPLTQALAISEFPRLQIIAGKPDKNVNEFIGNVQLEPITGTPSPDHPMRSLQPTETKKSAPLTIDNTAWANTVLASSSTTYAVVIYTGTQTRSALSTSASRSKTGLLEFEINNLTKILCALTFALSIILVALEQVQSTKKEKEKWYVEIMVYLILFSTIIPISLRVNLDMGKSVYSWFIERDPGIPDTVVRTSTIPEELGRVEYLLTDKTGTLTQNEMELKKIHIGTVSYANDAMDEVTSYVRQAFSTDSNQPKLLITPSTSSSTAAAAGSTTRTRREIGSRVRDVVLALALCHNVTPTTEDENGQKIVSYQASSPDEIAIVRWTENVGLRLVHRDRQSMALQSTDDGHVAVRVRILDIFPFTSEGKRMGIIVQFFQDDDAASANQENGEIWFYQKGADTVMSTIVAANDWLDEETANMAREGLRTLVVGRKKLSPQQYAEFSSSYKEASLALTGRDDGMARVVRDHLERDLELLGVTGVEDRLQRDVKPSLELLRNAGVKIWMLTGDKVETARCVAISAKLVARGQYIHTIAKLNRKDLAQDSLDFIRSKTDACLLIDGDSLSLMLYYFRDDFISLTVRLPAVIACRCSPTQKADLANLIREYTRKRICCIGDGGNDVSMIQAADVGVGIVGKEGRQASLAADFSITQFCHLTKLLVWHGRNSYKRSAKLAQFVMHRGLIISVCQTFYSIASHFEPNALFLNWLLVGYATVYTMAPVFSLVLDKDVDESLANLYPELYKELKTGRSLSYKTFFIWVAISIYQGGMIQGLSQILVAVEGPQMVAVSFTALILNELIMVAFEITTWHPLMIASLVGTGALYFGSIPFLGDYFDLAYVASLAFVWRVLAISAVALIPPYVVKLTRRTLKPPSYRKVRGL
ncbi:MAG: putative aminophospholipid-translocase [Cirrosporium novae-zelandiae]|nr:MAG: putative aminophospholipid-translocase [Cirrosporium novae-zelandiae]